MLEQKQERLEVLQDQALAAVGKKLDDLEDVIGKFPAVTDEELADLEVEVDPEALERLIESVREWEKEVDEQIENLLNVLDGGGDGDAK
ncbi:MAG: hypothetical protein HPY65_18030 [Syntrophaceae bacterium]|nr:hypothetical protein [Syntrophaceae bacterium]